jgi:Protein of unknown function (DUF3093)
MRYRERLHVPVVWWLLAVGLALSLLLALGFSAGPVGGVVAAVAGLAVATAIFLQSAVLIEVDDAMIRIGRAQIEHRYIGRAEALDAEQTRRRAGMEADARAHLVLRPYVGTAVEITLDDPEDSVPYWLVSTRRPQALAAALSAAVPAPRPDAVTPHETP